MHNSKTFNNFVIYIKKQFCMKKHLLITIALILSAKSLTAQNTQIGTWKKGEFTTEWKERTWSFDANKFVAGTNTISFTYKSGGKKLCLKDVQITADGKTVLTDATEQSAGYNPKSAVYTFTLSAKPKTIKMKAQARTDGGTNSIGKITLAVSAAPKAADERLKDGILHIKDGTTEIKAKEYYRTSALKKIVMPQSVRTIGAQAFFNCANLSEADIPASVKTIDESAFENCYSLSKITLHEGLDRIGSKAFKSAVMTEITIPKSVTELSNDIFYDCNKLTTIWVTKNSKAHSVFMSDSRLAIVGEGRVQQQPKAAAPAPSKWVSNEFSTTWTTREYDFSEKLTGYTEVATMTFTYTSGRHKLCARDITIEADGQQIYTSAAEVSAGGSPRSFTINCNVPKGTKSLILKGEFRTDGGTDSNGNITFMSSLAPTRNTNNTTYATTSSPAKPATTSTATTSTTSTTKPVAQSASEIPTQWGAGDFFTSWKEGGFDFSPLLKSSKTTVDQICVTFTHTGGARLCARDMYFMSNGRRLEGLVAEVTAGATYKSFSVTTSIPNDARYLELIGEFRTDGGSDSYGTISVVTNAISSGVDIHTNPAVERIQDGTYFIKSGTTVISKMAFSDNNLIKRVVIPSSVTKIDEDAFAGSSITEVDIPSSVQTIGFGAFSKCADLTKVTLHEGLKTIAASAFYQTPITEITIPGSVSDIGIWVFQGCKKLKRIYVKERSYADKFFNSDSTWSRYTLGY